MIDLTKLESALRAALRTFARWPSRDGNNFVPWWLIGWRVLYSPLILIGLACVYIGALFAYGPREAARVISDIL